MFTPEDSGKEADPQASVCSSKTVKSKELLGFRTEEGVPASPQSAVKQTSDSEELKAPSLTLSGTLVPKY